MLDILEERERARMELEAESAQAKEETTKEDIQIAADHASKMAGRIPSVF